jgi:hypothetical protein
MEHPIVINNHNQIGQDFDSLIAKYLATPAGRKRLAASMIQPIRRRLDYHGIARAAFPIQQLPDNAPYYPEGK